MKNTLLVVVIISLFGIHPLFAEAQSVRTALKLTSRVTEDKGYIETAVIAGFPSNKNVSYWKLKISCEAGAVILDYSGLSVCDKEYRYERSNMANPEVDYVMISAFPVVNSSASQQNVVFSLTAHDTNGNNIGGDKDGVTLGPNKSAPATLSEQERREKIIHLQQLLIALLQQLIIVSQTSVR